MRLKILRVSVDRRHRYGGIEEDIFAGHAADFVLCEEEREERRSKKASSSVACADGFTESLLISCPLARSSGFSRIVQSRVTQQRSRKFGMLRELISLSSSKLSNASKKAVLESPKTRDLVTLNTARVQEIMSVTSYEFT
jgi:hypothetical protein